MDPEKCLAQKIQFTRKGRSANIGQPRYYQLNVGVNPPRICLDLWTQKILWPKKFSLQGKPTGGGIALGFGEAYL